ncbi:hypothetical protein [Rhodopirellula bahusiensis]|uniref:Uncharacterized protein n=1 Tax=Rhodopirellula bahusiensis TaxID=2014065 RepID=A0A2G1WA64_9BACT|nr:hypothetical protein [Rhodopirellula bahusiensis]PHQ35917.1 hypothetical protein CEE69_06845 [Rhodopirellula bahusiensis]
MKMQFRFTSRLLLLTVLIAAIAIAAIRVVHDSLYNQLWDVASITKVHQGEFWSAVNEKTGARIGGPCVTYYATCRNHDRTITIEIGDSQTLYGKSMPLSTGDRFWFAANRNDPNTRRNPRFVDLDKFGVLLHSRENGTLPFPKAAVIRATTSAYQ